MGVRRIHVHATHPDCIVHPYIYIYIFIHVPATDATPPDTPPTASRGEWPSSALPDPARRSPHTASCVGVMRGCVDVTVR